MPAPPRPPLRRDAQRNRDAILTAARDLFAQSGDVPMYEIARRAEVGQATLYRHFPDRRAVAMAIFTEELDRLERRNEEHAGDPDAFFAAVRGIVELQTRLHGLVDCLRDEPLPREEKELLNQRLIGILRPALRAAKAAGTVRGDVDVDDVFLLISMVEGALRNEPDPVRRGAAANRALALTLDGLKTPEGAA